MTGTIRFLLEKLFLDFLAFYQRPGSETAKLKDHIRLLNKDVVKLKKMSAINQFDRFIADIFFSVTTSLFKSRI